MPISEERVVLVDERDRRTDTMDKTLAHHRGVLHRAISVIVYNGNGELLLQRRAHGKYHSPSLWSNTCCGHPRPGERVRFAAERRLQEEIGMVCMLEKRCTLRYRAEVPPNLIENELVHIFFGRRDTVPVPDPREVDSWRWVSVDDLRRDVMENGSHYTAWFKIYLDELSELLQAVLPTTAKG
jgi:isopentenyl-diphosphate delta-isomerase